MAMHGNMDSHPDIPTILTGLEKIAHAHDRNSNIAGALVIVGSAMFTIGSVMLKFQQKGIIK